MKKLEINNAVMDRIFELMQAGKSARYISKETGINKNKICDILKTFDRDSNRDSNRDAVQKSKGSSDIKKGDGNMNSNVDEQNELKTKYDELYEWVSNLASISSRMNANVTAYLDTRNEDIKTWNKCINEFRLGITGLFENVSELCNTVLIQQNRIDTLQQRVESLQTRLDAQMDINHQETQNTQPETKTDVDSGMDEDGFCALKTKKW